MGNQKDYKRLSAQKFYAVVALLGIVVAGYFVTSLSDGVSAYLLWLLSTSIVTFLLYGYDKMQSQRAGGRVPEVIFHGLALTGGFIGALVGRSVFRHKTQKPIFLSIIILATLMHVAAYFYL